MSEATLNRTARRAPTLKDRRVNVHPLERWASAVGGGVLTAYGLSRRSPAGVVMAALGGALVARGVTGHCSGYGALGVRTSEHNEGTEGLARRSIKIEEAVTIDRSAEQLYHFWRNFANLPRFMRHLESVTVQDKTHSHWVAKAPMGRTVAWDAEVINDIEGRLIAWKSLPGADVDNAGSVHFDPATGGRGTVVRVVLEYAPPAGRVGAAFARLSGEEPEIQVADDLRRFKALMETGEVPTNTGQPTGRGRP
jgi:uncharacterized membrane protein